MNENMSYVRLKRENSKTTKETAGTEFRVEPTNDPLNFMIPTDANDVSNAEGDTSAEEKPKKESKQQYQIVERMKELILMIKNKTRKQSQNQQRILCNLVMYTEYIRILEISI